MKILYTINGLRVNGMSTVIMQYISILDKCKYKITLMTDEIAPQYVEQLAKSNVNVFSTSNRKRKPIKYYWELKNLINREKFDVVHAHGNSATIAVEMLVAKKCNVPVRIAHSHNTTCKHKILDKILRPLLYKSYTKAIGCGVEAGEWLFGKREFDVVKNAVDLEHFKYDVIERDNIRKKLGVDDKVVVGHVGRFTEQKNHEAILDVFLRYSKSVDALLLLIGDGPRNTFVKNLVKQLGIEDKVIFYGTTEDTSKLYSAMDIFLFPSKFEGVPLTLVEAQANGLPCFISDTISKEVVLTDLVRVLELRHIEKWNNDIVFDLNIREEESQKALDILAIAGFDLAKLKNQLEKMYESDR